MILTNIVRASKAEPLAFRQLGRSPAPTRARCRWACRRWCSAPSPNRLRPSSRRRRERDALSLDQQLVFGANPGASGFARQSHDDQRLDELQRDPVGNAGLLSRPARAGRTGDAGAVQGAGHRRRNPVLSLYATGHRRSARRASPNSILNDRLDPSFEGFHHYVGAGDAVRTVRRTDARRQTGQVGEGGQGGQVGQRFLDERSPATDWRLCFNRKAWAPDTPYADNHPLCGSNEKMKDPRTVTFRDPRGKMVTAHVFPRSTFSIFQYLGRIVAAGDEGQIKLDHRPGERARAARGRHAVRGHHRRRSRSAAIASSRPTMAGQLLRPASRVEHQTHSRTAGPVVGAQHLDPRRRHHPASAVAAAVTRVSALERGRLETWSRGSQRLAGGATSSSRDDAGVPGD